MILALFSPLGLVAQSVGLSAADSSLFQSEGWTFPARPEQWQARVEAMGAEGWLLASLDTLESGEVHFFSGPFFSVVEIAGLEADSLLSTWDWHQGSELPYPIFFAMVENWKQQQADNSYPLARIGLQFFGTRFDTLLVKVNPERGQSYTFGPLQLNEDLLHPSFAEKMLGISHGEPYRRSAVDAIPAALEEWPSLELVGPIEERLQAGEAYLRLPLKKAQTDELDAVIGFLPDPRGGLLLIGQANLELGHLWKRGHSFALDWDRFGAQRQSFAVNYRYPFFLGGNFHLEGDFALLRQDSSFVNRSVALGVETLRRKGWQSSLSYAYSTTSLLTEPLQGDSLRGRQTHSLVVGLDWRRLDQVPFTRKGWQLNASLALGASRLSALESQGLSAERNTLSSYSLSLWRYQSLGKNWVLAAALRSAGVFSPSLYRGDQLRLGGLNSLRGFNENRFFADLFAGGLTELRWYWQAESYFLAFLEHSYLRDEVAEQELWPLGLGAGLALDTGGGLFQLVFASGLVNGQSLRLEQTRVHLGFTLLF